MELAIAALGLVGSIIAILVAIRANQIAKIASGEAEEAMQERIQNRWDKVTEILLELDSVTEGKKADDWNDEQRSKVGNLDKLANYNVEALLNVYEVVCGRYRDGSCNKSRFKKLHHDSIKKICEHDGRIGRILNLGPTCKFKAIAYVYSEWFDLESKIRN